MKTERRHDLQTNQLADWLGKHLEESKSLYKNIFLGLLALFVVVCIWLFVGQQKAEQEARIWAKYYNALNENDADAIDLELNKIADTTTTPGLWARSSAAALNLEEGSRLLFEDRDEALKKLENAKKEFTEVVSKANGIPLLLQQSRYGLAQTLECLGEIEKAKNAYEALAKTGKDSALGKAAAARAKALDDPSLVKFYDWFEKQKPQPMLSRGTGGVPPLDLNELPSEPGLKLPSTFDALSPPDDSNAKEEKQPEDKPVEKPAGPAESSDATVPPAKPSDTPEAPKN